MPRLIPRSSMPRFHPRPPPVSVIRARFFNPAFFFRTVPQNNSTIATVSSIFAHFVAGIKLIFGLHLGQGLLRLDEHLVAKALQF